MTQYNNWTILVPPLTESLSWTACTYNTCTYVYLLLNRSIIQHHESDQYDLGFNETEQNSLPNCVGITVTKLPYYDCKKGTTVLKGNSYRKILLDLSRSVRIGWKGTRAKLMSSICQIVWKYMYIRIIHIYKYKIFVLLIY